MLSAYIQISDGSDAGYIVVLTGCQLHADWLSVENAAGCTHLQAHLAAHQTACPAEVGRQADREGHGALAALHLFVSC